MISNDVYVLSAAFGAAGLSPASDRMARPL
jgi:hypothetical protein